MTPGCWKRSLQFRETITRMPSPRMGKASIPSIEHIRQLPTCVVILLVMVDIGEGASGGVYTGTSSSESFPSNGFETTKRDMTRVT